MIFPNKWLLFLDHIVSNRFKASGDLHECLKQTFLMLKIDLNPLQIRWTTKGTVDFFYQFEQNCQKLP